MLEGRDDLVCLWDLRVVAEHRDAGVGRALVEAVKVWATSNSCGEPKIETDTYNVAACRFYSAIGCELRSIRKNSGPDSGSDWSEGPVILSLGEGFLPGLSSLRPRAVPIFLLAYFPLLFLKNSTTRFFFFASAIIKADDPTLSFAFTFTPCSISICRIESLHPRAAAA